MFVLQLFLKKGFHNFWQKVISISHFRKMSPLKSVAFCRSSDPLRFLHLNVIVTMHQPHLWVPNRLVEINH